MQDHSTTTHSATLLKSYYRSLVGSAGTGIRMHGSSNVRMRNNLFGKHYSVEFQVEG